MTLRMSLFNTTPMLQRTIVSFNNNQKVSQNHRQNHRNRPIVSLTTRSQEDKTFLKEDSFILSSIENNIWLKFVELKRQTLILKGSMLITMGLSAITTTMESGEMRMREFCLATSRRVMITLLINLLKTY